MDHHHHHNQETSVVNRTPKKMEGFFKEALEMQGLATAKKPERGTDVVEYIRERFASSEEKTHGRSVNVGGGHGGEMMIGGEESLYRESSEMGFPLVRGEVVPSNDCRHYESEATLKGELLDQSFERKCATAHSQVPDDADTHH
jgi:hypothetical protein